MNERGKQGAPTGLVAAVALVVVGLFAVGLLAGGGDDRAKTVRLDNPATTDRADLTRALAFSAQLVGLLVPQPQYAIAHPTGPEVELRDSPGGRTIDRLGPRTEFGSPRTFLVAETRGDWLGVVAPELPNGRLGWIRADSGEVALSSTGYSIHVDLSSRSLELRYRRDVIHRATVSIGRAGHSTPAGLFSVTDALAGRGLGPWYGCCALAISGHQPNLPPGWVGGDRIAIHGTPGPVGGAVSTGCLRTTNRDMTVLFADVPLGAPVFVAR